MSEIEHLIMQKALKKSIKSVADQYRMYQGGQVFNFERTKTP